MLLISIIVPITYCCGVIRDRISECVVAALRGWISLLTEAAVFVWQEQQSQLLVVTEPGKKDSQWGVQDCFRLTCNISDRIIFYSVWQPPCLLLSSHHPAAYLLIISQSQLLRHYQHSPRTTTTDLLSAPLINTDCSFQIIKYIVRTN